MHECPNHKHLTDSQITAMTEHEAAVCDWLWVRWWILKGPDEDLISAIKKDV